MKKVVLAGVCLKQNDTDFESAMDECEALCFACDMEVCIRVVQKSDTVDIKTAFRSGKIEELAVVVKEMNADLVVFLNPLRVLTAERIAEACGCNVIDRTAVILDIFSKRAGSRQAKLQTEMARLQYDLPRVLLEADDHERSRGGAVTNRGGGEMRTAVIQKKYQARMQDLKKELAKIKERKSQDERRRTKSLMRRAALIGYTNAGKSSLMNAFISASVSAGTEVDTEDLLFKTLDTSVRTIEKDKKKFLLYDTVGFVSDLPHTLIEAFQTTLSAAADADLLIHVIDGSDENYARKIEITEQTLKEIGASEIPILRVYNKKDLMKEGTEIDGLTISCLSGAGIEDLIQEVIRKLYPDEVSIQCRLPYDRIAMLDQYQKVMNIQIIASEEEGMLLDISGPQRYVQVFKKYQTEGEI